MNTRYLYALLSFWLLSACGSEKPGANTGQTDDPRTRVVIAHLRSPVRTLHPTNYRTGNAKFVFEYTQKTLLKFDIRTLETVPNLAGMPEVSEDNTAYTFALNPTYKRADGQPVSAEDIVFTYKVAAAAATKNRTRKSAYANLKSVRADPNDPMRVTIRFKEPYVFNSDVFEYTYILQRHLYDPQDVLGTYSIEQLSDADNEVYLAGKVTEWFEAFNEGSTGSEVNKLTGLGPYKVTSYDENNVILERKADWSGRADFPYDARKPERIIFRVISEPAAILSALKSEELDVSTMLGNEELEKLLADTAFVQTYNYGRQPRFGYTFIALNMRPDVTEQVPFFEDVRVRRALAYATPYQDIIEVTANGEATQLISIVHPEKDYFNSDLKARRYLPDSAAVLLEAAGWTDSDGDGIRDKMVNGKREPLKFGLTYRTGPQTETIFKLVAEAYRKAGAEVEAVPVKRWDVPAVQHNFDAVMGSLSIDAKENDHYQLWHTSGWTNNELNFTGFGNDRTDQLLEDMRLTFDEADRHLKLNKMQKIIYDQVPYIFLYAADRKIVIHKRFGDDAGMYAEAPGVILNNLSDEGE